MGPSGSGKSTLMHILAGLDRPTSGTVALDGDEITGLDDGELTKLRRDKLGFVFQFFNLLPVADRRGEHRAAALDRRAQARPRLARAADAHRRPRGPPHATGPPSSPAASSSGSPSPGPWSPNRRSSSPTSRPATSTRRRAPTCCALLRQAVDEFGQTVIMVTHDPAAAAHADRVLILADGTIVRDAAPDLSEVVSATHDLYRRLAVGPGGSQRAAVPAQPHDPDGDSDRPRRRHGQRHLCPHGHDHQGLRRDLQRLLREDERGDHRQEHRLQSSGNVTVPQSLVGRVQKLPGVAEAAGAIFDLEGASDKAQLIGRDGKTISSGGSPTFGFGFDADQTRFNPMTLTAGHWARSGGEVVIDQGTADSEGFEVGEKVGVAAIGPIRHFTITGIARFGSVPSLGGATIAVFTVAEAQRLLDKEGTGRPDLRRRQAGGQPERGGRTNPTGAAARNRGPDRHRTGRRQRRRRQRIHPDHPLHPARLRRDRRPGRRLRHLQHHLDHRRPEDPGVRHPCGRWGRREGRCCARC